MSDDAMVSLGTEFGVHVPPGDHVRIIGVDADGADFYLRSARVYADQFKGAWIVTRQVFAGEWEKWTGTDDEH